MGSSGFLIENAATRASLKSAFDHLFCKYGREFEDDDEIDLADLSIVNIGGHVLREKTRGFGSCYKKATREQDRALALEAAREVVVEEEQEDNYDDVFKRISGNVKAAQMRARFEPLTFSPLPPLRPPRRTESNQSIGSPRTKTASKLRELVLSESEEEVGDGSEEDQSMASMASPSRDRLRPSFSFDEHLQAILAKEQRPITGTCACRSPSCFDCHLMSICLM